MEYKKDFDSWNKVKKKLDTSNREVFFRKKEIWWTSLGVNIGSEQDGKGRLSLRPVYIVKKINSQTFMGVPLTKSLKEDQAHMSFYFDYDFSTAIISQTRILDKKRLFEKLGSTSDYVYIKMKKTIQAYFG